MDPTDGMQPQEQSPHQTKPPNSSYESPSFSTITVSSSCRNHIRTRITVVCAECKRLKLRCDRRLPCGSCVKRDTVARCKYSQAAAEKVDLQSVNNRVIALEAQVALLNSINTGVRSVSLPDRALLAIGSSGSSLAISLDDVTSVWLSHLNLAPTVKLKLETAPVELPTDDLLPTTLFPPIAEFRASSSPLEPPSVTTKLMFRLPPRLETRQHLLDALEDVLAMQPCFNFPHFQSRVHSMFTWAKELEAVSARDPFSSSNGARATMSSKPTLSFFAAASAAFALGALVSKTSDDPTAPMMAEDPAVTSAYSTDTLDGDPSCSPAALFALSEQALSVFEKSYNYDLDYLVAIILQVIFLLHDDRPRLTHVLFPLVGKMVNVARMMGLGSDPDDFPGIYPLFEAETRRRIWWDIFYYDLFVSDCMGQLPLIADNSFTTRLPAVVDEQQFNPVSTTLPLAPESCKTSNVYFRWKCRLAQLVKSLKKQTFRDPLIDTGPPELSIDEAAESESRVTQFIADLPSDYQIDLNSSNLPPSNDPQTSLILARAYELNIIANRLIIALYLPFLKANPLNPLHQASLATVNAAHKIVHSMKAWNVDRSAGAGRGRWGSFGVYYEYGRILFDAAVMCASMSINCHDSAFAQCVRDDVDTALETMKEIEKLRPRRAFHASAGKASGLEGNVTEGVMIVELLKKKADAVRIGSGLKRKRHDADRDVLLPSFLIPFAGVGISSTGSIGSVQDPTQLQPDFITPPAINRLRSDISSVKVKVEASKDDSALDLRRRSKEKLGGNEKRLEPGKSSTTKDKGREKDKGPKYPAYGIRVRPGFAPPYARSRTSLSPSTAMPNGPGPPPHGLRTPSVSEGPILQSHPPTPGFMLPPAPTTMPSSTELPSKQGEGLAGYFSTSTYRHDVPMNMQGDDPLSNSFLGQFDSPVESGMHGGSVGRRYNSPAFATNSPGILFEQTYGSSSKSTSPTSSQPTPPFPPAALSQNGQYGSSSQQHSNFYPSNYGGPSKFDNSALGLGTAGIHTPSTRFVVNPTQHHQSTSQTDSSYMSPHSKIQMFTVSSEANSNHVQSQLKDRGGDAQMEMELPGGGQEWLSSAPQSSTIEIGDSYWAFKSYAE